MAAGEHNATTISLGKLRTLIIFVIVLVIVCTTLAIVCEDWWVPHLPWFLMHVLVNVKKPLFDLLAGASMALIWCAWSALVFFLATFGQVSIRWAVLLPLAALWVVLVRKDPAKMTYPGGAAIMRLFWDPPLLINVFLVEYLFGATYLHDGEGDYHSHMDDNVLVASLPTPRRVKHLASIGVKAVVNMCAEYPGPVSAYKAHGIEQLHLPTLDATSPSEESLTRAVEFINAKIKSDPKGKVLIHCKGGRGRAASVCLCYMVARGGKGMRETFADMRDRRAVVEPVVLSYKPVRAFCERHVQTKSSTEAT